MDKLHKLHNVFWRWQPFWSMYTDQTKGPQYWKTLDVLQT